MTMPDTRRVLTIFAILFLIALAAVSPASAIVIVDDSLEQYSDMSVSGTWNDMSGSNWDAYYRNVSKLYVPDISKVPHVNYLVYDIPGDWGGGKSSGTYEFTYTLGDKTNTGRYYLSYQKNVLGQIQNTRYTFFFDDWDISGLVGPQIISLSEDFMFNCPRTAFGYDANDLKVILWADTNRAAFPHPQSSYTSMQSIGSLWRQRIYVEDIYVNDVLVKLDRLIAGKKYGSTIEVYSPDESLIYQSYGVNNEELLFRRADISEIVITDVDNNQYRYSIGSTETPTDPSEVFRTGTVTMTDHNGTTISGFEVKAVNHYTGEEYTASTDTDVATITLPMDRTIEIRNPQTGVYEEAPIGYYRFFGYKDGYKMTNEDGVRISVMPEEYTSYHLCDIIVRSETGYLTGKHQFQLRSRSDNSILQTGTISAQSATTGEWYNTTVIDGIATLILPYDTSNPISQYAGNYFVYGTSPGYEDSEYATRVTVMPQTSYEIRDIYLTPIGGVPVPGNVTLRIQAFSETGPGIPNARIFISGIFGAGSDVWDTYTASSTGYLEVSVPGNSTYDISAYAEGYYNSARRITVYTDDPPLIEIKLYLSGAPTVEPTTQPTGWITTQPTTQPTGGIPDDDDGSESFLMVAVRGIGQAFGVGFATAKLIFGTLLALSIGFATAKQLRGGAAEFGLGLLGGTMLGVLIGLLPVWIIVVLLLVVGLYIGHRYVGGGNNG